MRPVRQWTWGNGTMTVRDYDTDWQISSINSAGLSTYLYRPDGLIEQITGENALVPPLAVGTTNYTISATSNRLAESTGLDARAYTYDAAGNTLADGARTFAYNDAGRMVSATAQGLATGYTVNALGQRVSKTSAAATSYAVYDEDGHVLGEYDVSGEMIREVVWLGDIPVATLRLDGAALEIFYIHTDHLNTPRRITRPADGVVVWNWSSDPFGVGVVDEDPDGDFELFVFNLRFPGQHFDSETGLHYNYFRDYDPSVGRYLQSDPIGLNGGINTYLYAGAKPTLNIDEFGLQSHALCANPVNFAACAAAGMEIPAGAAAVARTGAAAAAAAATAGDTAQTRSRALTWPERRKGFWTCTCRADCNDNIPGNCPEDPNERFQFGTASHEAYPVAVKLAKRAATQAQGCQPKHIPCVCVGPSGERRRAQ